MTTSTVDKIRLLLAKAEGTTNEHERDAYLAMASKLQLRHQIDDAMLAPEQQPVDALITRIVEGLPKGAGYIKAKRDLVYGLASIFGLKSTIAHDRSVVKLYGHTFDIEFVQQMFNSLVTQLELHMAAHAPRGADRSWRTSFAHGWVQRVTERLRMARSQQRRDVIADEPGTDIVLRDRGMAVDQYYANLFAGVKMGSSYRNRSVRSYGGYLSGQAAGDRANLGQTPVTARRRALEG